VVKVFGHEFGELRRIAGELVELLQKIPGAADVTIDQEPPLPQIQVRVNREAAARFGINIADIATIIESGIGGKAISTLFIGDRVYDIAVRFPESVRSSSDAIGSLTVTLPSGARIPLSQVAEITTATGESSITRELMEGRAKRNRMLSRNNTKDGRVIWCQWYNSVHYEDGGKLTSILSLAEDVTARMDAEEQLRQAAVHDALTGLPNRNRSRPRARHRAREPQRRPHRAPLHRPGSPQESERHAPPCGGRRGPAAGGRAHPRMRSRSGHRGAAGRGRVRRAAGD
jgi:hypothetical protein